MPILRLPVTEHMPDSLRNRACVMACVKNKKRREILNALFLAPFHCHAREVHVKMKMFLARSLAKMAGCTGFYRFVSLRVRKFSLERIPDLYLKERRHDALKTVVFEGKDTICILPAKYGKSLTVSVTSRLHTSMNLCVCL